MQFKENDSYKESVLTDIFNVAKYLNICCENKCEGVQRDDDRKGVHR